MKFKLVDTPDTALRNAYLDSLPEPQELFIENHVASGTAWQLDDKAYAVIHQGILVEFFVDGAFERGSGPIVYETLLKNCGVKQVLCKSFDRQLLYVALSFDCRVSSPGLLYRRILDSRHTPRRDVSIRKGSASDCGSVLRISDGFFDDAEELQTYVRSEGLYLLIKDGEVIGCGIAKRVIDSRPEVDIGMLVAAEHRRQGYGSYLVSYLIDHYLQQGIRPVCGCGSSNEASQRALSTAGFVSEHRILRISY